MAEIARDLMDLRQPDPKNPTRETLRDAIQGLSNLTWDAHQAPWRNLMLISDADKAKAWRIRSEDRKNVLLTIRLILRWQLGLDELQNNEVIELRERWQALLLPALEESVIDELWREIVSNIMR